MRTKIICDFSQLFPFLRLLLKAAVSLALFSLVTGSAASAANIAVYVTNGAQAESMLALFRAITACGHTVYGISNSDIANGRLTIGNFDVLIVPQGQDGSRLVYSDPASGLGAPAVVAAIKNFVDQGGGFIGIEAGAEFAAYIGLYGGTYIPCSLATCGPNEGVYPFSVSPDFGSGTQHLFIPPTGGYFPPPPPGATAILTNALGSTSAVKFAYGSGRVILMAPNPTLRGDSDLDWTRWDNWVMGDTHPNSIGAWQLFGKMVNWVDTGNAVLPDIHSENPVGRPVAILSSYIPVGSGSYGGAWPGLLPAVGRAVEHSGHIPLAVRFIDVRNGRLTPGSFGAVVFPGGNAAGYATGLAGTENLIRTYVSEGGCYLGICAGSFYASSSINWEGGEYDYPLDLFAGRDIGPIADLSEDPMGDDWTYYTLTPITINDTVLGNIGTLKQFYFGGGYKTDVPGVTAVATYAADGSSAFGKTDAIRFTYGKGRVLLSGAHPEVRAGNNADWLFWDNYFHNSNTPLNNPDNPWLFTDAIFNTWFFPPLPERPFYWPLFLPALTEKK